MGYLYWVFRWSLRGSLEETKSHGASRIRNKVKYCLESLAITKQIRSIVYLLVEALCSRWQPRFGRQLVVGAAKKR